MYITDSTHLYAPNITPDSITGLGKLEDHILERAIKDGIGHDGRNLSFMPIYSKTLLTNEDIKSIIAYLRTIPSIKKENILRKLSREEEKNIVERKIQNEVNFTLSVSNDTLKRGIYLISIGNCVDCHTARYKRNPGLFGGGNPMGYNKEQISSTNISSDSTGIGTWSSEVFKNVMKTGKNGSLNKMMPWTSYKNMTDLDIEAIYLALKTTIPIRHFVANGPEPTFCEVCEERHGLGEMNKVSIK